MWYHVLSRVFVHRLVSGFYTINILDSLSINVDSAFCKLSFLVWACFWYLLMGAHRHDRHVKICSRTRRNWKLPQTISNCRHWRIFLSPLFIVHDFSRFLNRSRCLPSKVYKDQMEILLLCILPPLPPCLLNASSSECSSYARADYHWPCKWPHRPHHSLRSRRHHDLNRVYRLHHF